MNLSEEHLKELLIGITNLQSFRDKLEQTVMNTDRERVSKIIEMTLIGAIHFEASDIHIEPEDGTIKLDIV